MIEQQSGDTASMSWKDITALLIVVLVYYLLDVQADEAMTAINTINNTVEKSVARLLFASFKIIQQYVKTCHKR